MAAPPSGKAPQRTVLPKLVTSPVWSLQPWPVIVTLGGDTYTIPAEPAATWLSVLMGDDTSWLDVFPTLADDDAQDRLTEAVLDDRVDGDEITDVAQDILTTVSARPWWVAIRLIRVAVTAWDYIGGEVAMRGVDASRLSLSAWLDAVYHIILRAMDPKDHTSFLSTLEMPPAHLVASLPEPEMSADAFAALMR